MIVGFKIFIDLFDMLCTLVVYISYNMGNWDLPDIYPLALRPAALGLGDIYQANPSSPCYNYYLYQLPLVSLSFSEVTSLVELVCPLYPTVYVQQ